MYIFKIVHGLSSLYLSQFFNQQPARLDICYMKRWYYQGVTMYNFLFKKNPSSIRHWNSLDYSIWNLDSISLFKRSGFPQKFEKWIQGLFKDF